MRLPVIAGQPACAGPARKIQHMAQPVSTPRRTFSRICPLLAARMMISSTPRAFSGLTSAMRATAWQGMGGCRLGRAPEASRWAGHVHACQVPQCPQAHTLALLAASHSALYCSGPAACARPALGQRSAPQPTCSQLTPVPGRGLQQRQEHGAPRLLRRLARLLLLLRVFGRLWRLRRTGQGATAAAGAVSGWGAARRGLLNTRTRPALRPHLAPVLLCHHLLHAPLSDCFQLRVVSLQVRVAGRG